MKVLGISGSLRRDSHNTALLRAAAELVPGGVELELWDGLRAVPPYDEDDDVEPAPAAVTELRDAVAGADAILFATPEYNHSIPGQLKNALDWASRPLATNPLRNKPVAVVGASIGAFGAVWAQAELRKVPGGDRRARRRRRGRGRPRAPAIRRGRPAGGRRSARAARRGRRRAPRRHTRPGAAGGVAFRHGRSASVRDDGVWRCCGSPAARPSATRSPSRSRSRSA